MAIIPPWAMDALDGQPEYDGAALRAIFAAMLGKGDTPTRAREGVVDGLDVTVLDDVVYVSPGLGVVTTLDGSFITGLGEEEAFALEARDPTNGRVDRVVLQVHHTPTNHSASCRVISGTAAPSAMPPSTPEGALSLGTVTVPSAGGAGAVFNPGQVYTAGRGGAIRVPNGAAMRRLPNPSPYTEVIVESGGDAGKWVYVNGNWGRSAPIARTTYTDGEVFSSMASGVTLMNAEAVVDSSEGSRSTCTIRFAVSGLSVDNGNQNTEVGSLVSALAPSSAVPLSGYRTNGALRLAVTGSGVVGVRWSSVAASNQMFFSGSYTI